MSQETERCPHDLTRVKGGNMPKHVIIVAAEYAYLKNAETDRVSSATLSSGYAIFIDYTATRATKRRVFGFHDAESFTSKLNDYAKGKPNIHVYGFGIRDLASVLGLWQQIIDGEVTLHGDDPLSQRKPSKGKKRLSQGYAVLEDPPTVVKLRNTHTGSIVTWTDVQNFGVEDYTQLVRELQAATGHKLLDEGEEICYIDRSRIRAMAVEYWLTEYMKMLGTMDLGGLQSTGASQAMHSFKYRFLSEQILVHGEVRALKREREALYGGRCECRFIGRYVSSYMMRNARIDADPLCRVIDAEGPVMHLDVNSLYPAVAKSDTIPTVFHSLAFGQTPDSLRRMIRNTSCIARVKVKTEVPCVPCRLDKGVWTRSVIRDKSWDGIVKTVDDRTVYPVGEFWTTLCGPELSIAYKYGAITKVKDVACYASGRPFAAWVDELYFARNWYGKRGEITMARACKRLLNALFGKFAQRNKRWLPVDGGLCQEPFAQWWGRDAETGLPCQFRSFAWQLEKLCDMGEHIESVPAITAWIQSLARVRLWELMEAAGRENVYYYDTDSLWTNAAGSLRLTERGEMSSDGLGKLKLVGVHNDVAYYGIKHYDCDGKSVCAGIPRGTKREEDGTLSGSYSVPITNQLWKRQAPTSERAVIRYRMNRPYRHGKVEMDGRVMPWRLVMGDD